MLEGRLYAMKAALILFGLALIEMASAPCVSATAIGESSARILSCSVASEASPAEISESSGSVPLGLAMADFTGDSHPDVATLALKHLDSSGAYFIIQIQLSEGGRQSLKLTGPARSLIITPMDVTGDGPLDLVVRSVGSKVPVAVFLNDGCGHFSANEPARFANAVQEIPGGPDFDAALLRFGSTNLARGTHAGGTLARSHCFLEDFNTGRSVAYNGAKAEMLLPLRSDRAPPIRT
jgi:hypothetical protein